MYSLGTKYKNEFQALATSFEENVNKDSADIDSYIGVADSYIMQFIFGYVPHNEGILPAEKALANAIILDPNHTDVHRLRGAINFLNWNYEEAEEGFKNAILADPKNLNARHWYSLWHVAMNDFKAAVAQHDTISKYDVHEQHLIGTASIHYFQYQFEDMIHLMDKELLKNPDVPWGYDWLGMAYNGLKQHDKSIETYLKAFELSDGTVEVGGGLGHALADGGYTKEAEMIANHYAEAAKTKYLPAVQRSFIHIGLKDYDTALDLLEQAHDEQSWFLSFIQTEHWYDPIRHNDRFKLIIEKMNFPN